MWSKLSTFILSNRVRLLLAFILLTIFMGWESRKVQLSFAGSKILPITDSADIKYTSFKQKFGEDGSIMVLGIQSPKLLHRLQFNNWLKLNDEIKKLKGIQQVLSVGKLYELKKDTAQHKFVMLPISPSAVKTDLEMDSIRRKIHMLPFYEGLVLNSKSNASLMAITFSGKTLNSAERIPVMNAILNKAQAFTNQNHIPIHYSGLPYIRTVASKLVSKEFVLFLGLSIAVAALILLLFFRSFYPVIIPVSLVVIGVVWSVGLMVLFGYQITLLTGLIPPLIVVIGIPNCILILNKYHVELNKNGEKLPALQRTISQITITTFIANVTTAIGFGVLYFTHSELLMQFGIIASISIMAVWFICLCLVPILFSFLPTPQLNQINHSENRFLANLLSKTDSLVHSRRSLIYMITVLLLFVSAYGISLIKVNGFIVDDLPKNSPVIKDMKFFEKNFEGVLPLEVSIDSKRKNGIMNLTTIKKVEKVQKMIAAYPEISRPVSLIEVLKFSSQAFYQGDSAYYRVPNDMEQGFILSYAANSGGNGNLLKSFLDKNKQVTRLSFQIADIGSDKMNTLFQKIKPRIDSILNPAKFNVELTGTSVIFVKGTNYLVKNLRDSLLLAIGLIAILMWVLFRGWLMIFISLIPNLVPLVITAGIMGYFGIALKPSTILIFSIAFGIASDQTIYFLTKYRQELQSKNGSISQIVSLTLRETGVSMIYVAMILFFGFGIFTASTFGGTVSLGLLLSITLLVALISNLTLLPALLLSVEKKLK